VKIVMIACLVAILRLANAGDASNELRTARVEHGMEPLVIDDAKHPLALDIRGLMKIYNEPALSIAVIDDYRIVWTKAYGVVGADDPAPVNDNTLFQAGSISKPVAATAMLELVESGKLSLDENVNTYLKTWKLPENEFTKDAKVTLRRLASHSAGTTVHGFPGYDIDAALPTIAQILDGTPPANTVAVRVNLDPGTKMRYSGGGITIEQLVMTDVTGEAFPELLRKSVFDKLDMHDSTFEQPLPPDRAAYTAHGTYASGKPVHGRWHIYPEMAAAGLWTTPTDLAKFAIETALAEEGKSAKVLSTSMTRERLMAQPGTDNGVGLGFFLTARTPGEFGHDGADEGFQASLVMNAKTGKGVVVMTNSDNGMLVAWELIRSVASEYAWPTVPKERSLARRLCLIGLMKGADATLKAYTVARADPKQAKDITDGVLAMVAWVVHESGKPAVALKILQRNASDYPDSAEARAALGEALAEAHQAGKAKAAFEAALKIDPKNPTATEGLKKLGSNVKN
jgi:CubicO group peptidase (beta-lactamase class C family)